MQENSDHIRTTHTGSLPRPDDLVELLYADERGESDATATLQARIRSAVAEVTAQQCAAGVEILNDGEMGKVGYSTYITTRLTGYEDKVNVPRAPRSDAADFPRYVEWNAKQQAGSYSVKRYACTRPVTYVGQADLQRDLE